MPLTLACSLVALPSAAHADTTVTGSVTTNAGQITWAQIGLHQRVEPEWGGPPNWERVAGANVMNDGSFSLTAPDGSYTRSLKAGVTSDGISTSLTHVGYTTLPAASPLEIQADLAPVTVNLTDQNGERADADAQVSCEDPHHEEEDGPASDSSSVGRVQGSATLYAMPGIPCTLVITHDDGVQQVRGLWLEGTAGEQLDFEVDAHTVSGTVTLPGGSADRGQWSIEDAGEQGYLASQAVAGDILSEGRFHARLAPGSYVLNVNAWRGDDRLHSTRRFEVTDADRTIDVAPRITNLELSIRDGDGNPAERTATLACGTYDEASRAYDSLEVTGSGSELTLSNVPGHRSPCRLTVGDKFGDVHLEDPGPTQATFYTATGAVIHGDPETAVDQDGVDAQVEALAPNSGDGNNDGVYDYRQDNVASLPADTGSWYAPYVSVESPEGTTLVGVSSLGTSGYTAPSGTSLRIGLTSFTVEGVDPGSDQVITLWSSGLWNVTDYAKYDLATGQWSYLPRDRVDLDSVHQGYMKVTLTDGGVGDADGVADGRIVDPGGPAFVSTPQDTSPPVVTGEIVEVPGSGGWYADDVTVRWTATDDSSDVTAPADTVVDGEGADLSATSTEVCDPAGNCASGSVSGIKIDRTPPQVSLDLSGRYVLGSVPSPGCAASDLLSGLLAPCQVSATGANSNGTGFFEARAVATDVAGNSATDEGRYRVTYRVDGFEQPVNDPRVKPEQPMSVFKSGSTVTVRFVLRDNDGTPVTPDHAPVWLPPEQRDRTKAAVNEAVDKSAGSSGQRFTPSGDFWEYRWSTKGVASGYEWRIAALTDDGAVHTVKVAVR